MSEPQGRPQAAGRTHRSLAYALAAIVGLLWVLGGFLLSLNVHVVYGNQWFLWGLFTVTGVAYVAAAIAIVRRQPSNAVGWLFFLIAGALALGTVMPEYGIYALRVSPGALPAPDLVLALAQPTPAMAIIGIVLVLQLFPNGRPVSPRWRVVVRVTVAALVLGTIAQWVVPHRIVKVWSDDLDHAHVSALDPLGVPALRTAGHVAQTVLAFVFIATAILSVVSLFVRRRKADPVQHTQLRWLAYVVGVAALWIVVMFPLSLILGQNGPVAGIFWIVATPLVALGIPISVGIAIVRHRLLDIDVVISKTIVYGALAAFITVVYVGVVIGVGQLAGSVATPALSAVAAAIVALAFQPLRRRVQRLADRFVYGRRVTPYEALSDFSERVAGAYSTDDVLPRMAEIVATGTGVTRAEVWLRVGGEIRPEASWPGGAVPRTPMRMSGGDLPDFGAKDAAFPVRHQGDLLGAIVVEAAAGDPLTAAKDKLIMDLAAQAGLVLRNARLLEELRASRQRIVAAQDERARALERNIHDGAQQQLVALAVKLRLTRSLAEKDPAKTGEMLESLQRDATDALENLRDLARGIYPPLLADQGLPAALDAQARKSAFPVTVDSDGVDRYPPEVESAVYFCALEALQNVAKYANASHAVVRLAGGDGHVTFEVRDDGVGFEPEGVGYGSGLQGMTDRLDALGGSLTIQSAPGAGTCIRGRVPAGG
jgi:signal transduction histidine kinase